MAPIYRSHRTQVLLNYFPDTDQRVREEPYTIDAQLLNCAAMSLDDSQLRVAREADSMVLGKCPAAADNGGVYYALNLPAAITPAPGASFTSQVTGTLGTDMFVLQEYDDRLPVPGKVVQDTSRQVFPLTQPILFDITGSGDVTFQVWDLFQEGPFSLPIPNKLTFWVEGVQGANMSLSIFIQGSRFPAPVWADQQSTQSESLAESSEGAFTSTLIWQDVTSVTVRGLPAGVRLRCWQIPFNLPAFPDPDRPFTHSVFRDQMFDRYWQLSADDNQVKELYMMDNYSTLEYVQSYQMVDPLTALAVEPRTWGMIIGSGSTLMYWDRREPMPDHLEATALTTEPYYGIDVRYDIVQSGLVRYVRVSPVAYGSAVLVTRWRYLLDDPAGDSFILNTDGSLSAYSGSGGWQTGAPQGLTVPVTQIGTYLFTLECVGSAIPTPLADAFPYPNLGFSPTATFDLSGFLSSIEGLAFDVFEQLWAWTGTQVVPLVLQPHAYILDTTNRVLYLTNQYDSVTIS